MNRGGRPKDDIWNSFFEIRTNGKLEAKCKACGHKLCSKVDRMKSHFRKCNKVTGKEDNSQDLPVSDPIPETTGESIDQPIKRPFLQQTLETFTVMTSKKSKSVLDNQVARFFYACNIPFLACENPQFIALCSLLRPGYTPPSRKQLSEDLLDEVSCELEQNMKLQIEGKECTLIEDGWSNNHNEAVLASCLIVEGKSYFLRANESGSNAKTAEYCKENVSISIKEAKERYNCSVRSIVTDNARNMEKMRRMLYEEDKTLLVYGCSAHWLNLLGQDVTPPQIIKPIIEVQKYFRNHHKPAALLKDVPNAVKPQLPNDTRWNSNLQCIETFLRNRPAYLKVAEECSIDKSVEKLINDFNLYKQAKDLLTQLKPIGTALDILQGDSASLSDACHYWLYLASCDELKPHITKVRSRMAQALTPFHYLAYMTDPHSKGERLNQKQREEARNWLYAQQPENLEYLIAFEGQSNPFPGSFLRIKSLLASTWWKALRVTTIPEDFILLMIKLHSSPCSSASVERIFSNFGHIHNKIRNRLDVQKAAKLVFCYRMLRGPVDLEF